jgi:N-acyl-D-amino-acid deacylase
MVDFYGKEEHIVRFLCRPEQNLCTDGLLGGTPHPRAFGAFPRVLGKYVREERVLSLESAVRKMTAKTAEVFGLSERGRVAVGYCADLVVFDPQTVLDRGTFINPRQYPDGIRHVLVNGELVLQNGQLLKSTRAGRVLRAAKTTHTL